eukprot:g74576.t1
MITQIAHYPEYRPEDPSDDYPTYWVTFYSRKGAVRCSRVGEVPDPAVQGGRLVIRQGPKPFPKVPMHPDLGKQLQAAPNPRPDPATTKGNDPSPPEIPEATASLKEPTTLPKKNHLSASAIGPHIFEGVTRKSRSKSPPTARADSDDEIDLEHLINDEAEGWRLEQEEKRQQSRNTPPPPTTPTPDKCKEQQTRASVDTPPGMSNQAPPLPISTTSQLVVHSVGNPANNTARRSSVKLNQLSFDTADSLVPLQPWSAADVGVRVAVSSQHADYPSCTAAKTFDYEAATDCSAWYSAPGYDPATGRYVGASWVFPGEHVTYDLGAVYTLTRVALSVRYDAHVSGPNNLTLGISNQSLDGPFQLWQTGGWLPWQSDQHGRAW